ncbi:MAG: SpoIIIAH-like family protein [Lachnospiraceae bacterium]|nr:SpoIIIAH-like family protein [Lachnospiraceae bacterium]
MKGNLKGVFKKNQVIITSLALMLAVAGFLQMAGDKKTDDLAGAGSNSVASADAGTEEYYQLSAGNISDSYADISDEDMAGDALAAAENEAAQATSAEVQDADAALVADGSETTDDIGEAVLVSTTIRGDYAVNAKLYREQTRAKNKETLMEILGDETISEDQKQETINALLEMTEISEKEQAAELLLEAKGFSDAVVNIVDEEVDVVINATSVTDSQIAQIEDIVMRKTGAEAENIVITAAVQQD